MSWKAFGGQENLHNMESPYLLFVSARREDTCIRGCERTTGWVGEAAKLEIFGLEELRIRLGAGDDRERGCNSGVERPLELELWVCPLADEPFGIRREYLTQGDF